MILLIAPYANGYTALLVIALIIAVIVAISNHLQCDAAESKLKFVEDHNKGLQRVVDFFFKWRDRHSKALKRELEPIYNLASFLSQKFPQIARLAEVQGKNPCDAASSIIIGQDQIIGELKKRIEINQKKFDSRTEMMSRQRNYQFERSAALQDHLASYIEFASVVAEYATARTEQSKKFTIKRSRRIEVLIEMIKDRLAILNATDIGGTQKDSDVGADAVPYMATQAAVLGEQARGFNAQGQDAAKGDPGPVLKFLASIPCASPRLQ